MRMNIVWAVFLSLVVLSLTNCSQLSAAPSDAEVIKSMESLNGSLTGSHVTNVVILEKGRRLENGRWPFKVKYDVKYDRVNPGPGLSAGSGPDGEVWYIYKEQDKMGKSIWTASPVAK